MAQLVSSLEGVLKLLLNYGRLVVYFEVRYLTIDHLVIASFNLVIKLAGVLFFQETYALRIIAIKAKKLRQKTENQELRIKWQKEGRTLPNLLRMSLTRPWRLLGTYS